MIWVIRELKRSGIGQFDRLNAKCTPYLPRAISAKQESKLRPAAQTQLGSTVVRHVVQE